VRHTGAIWIVLQFPDCYNVGRPGAAHSAVLDGLLPMKVLTWQHFHAIVARFDEPAS
jgi:hypothetical protein